MRMVLKLDAGPVADVERVKIEALDTATHVESKLAQACVPLLARCLPAIESGTQLFTEQNETGISFCRRLGKTDGALDFNVPATAIAARINGLMPWPGCSVTINGQVVKLGVADVIVGPNGVPGEVMGADEEGLLVATPEQTLRLRLLQRPGGRMLPAAEFLRGWPVVAGTQLPSQPMQPLVANTPFPRLKPPA
jgi:methionyl-tRNA formyltransferase